jgi:hypothetical protein
MWLLYAFRRRTFPDPVTEKRFLAPLWVFIFGMFYSRQRSTTPMWGGVFSVHALITRG